MSEKKIARPRLTQDELDLIIKYRRIKEESDEAGVNVEDVKHGWLKSENSSLFFKNPHFKTETEQGLIKLKEEIIKFVKDGARDATMPASKITKRSTDPHLLMIDPADIHIGKLATSFETGEDYNSQIAVKRVREGVDGLLKESSGYLIDKILFIVGNDIIHTDTKTRTTTGGTPQDTDGMWYENFMTAQKLYIEIIDKLLRVAPVHVVFNPSNHDNMTGFFLVQLLDAYYSKTSMVTFDSNMRHRKAFTYYNNLIGTTHGDGAKQADLPLLLATEYPMEWAATKRRYIFGHHVHHRVSKDYIGVEFQTLRSPSSADSWHHVKGYQHAPKAIEGFIFHRTEGRKACLTHYF